MTWWCERVVPRLADRMLDTADVHELRRQTCAGLTGRVLEVGFGSGLNARHYPAAVAEVGAVEPSDVAWRMARPRVAGSGTPVHRAGLDGQRLALPDDSFDSALSTFSLCTIPDVRAALAEIRRVLKPGGLFHFAEHGRAPDAAVERWQRRLEPLHGRLAGGCRLTRRIDELVAEQLTLVDLTTEYGPGPAPSRPFSYRYSGRAVAP